MFLLQELELALTAEHIRGTRPELAALVVTGASAGIVNGFYAPLGNPKDVPRQYQKIDANGRASDPLVAITYNVPPWPGAAPLYRMGVFERSAWTFFFVADAASLTEPPVRGWVAERGAFPAESQQSSPVLVFL